MTPVPRRGPARLAAALVLALAASLATGCGVTRGDETRDMQMMIPNSPGGGYDQTGRAAVSVMEQEDVTGGSFEVTNIIARSRSSSPRVTPHPVSVAAASASATPAATPRRRPCPITPAIRGVLSSSVWFDRHGPCGVRHH